MPIPKSVRYSDKLAYAEVSPRERVIASWVAGLGIVFTLSTVPFAHAVGGEAPSFLPTITALAAFSQLLTAFLLFNQYRGSGYPPLAVLALAYAGAAVLGIERLFAGSVAATEAALGHAYFVTYVILFAGSEAVSRRLSAITRSIGLPALTALTVVVLGASVIWSTRPHPHAANGLQIALLGYMLLAYVVVVLCTHFRTVVHVALAIVIALSFCEVLISPVLVEQTFSLGWYVGRCESLVAASLLLIVLMGSVYRILLSLTSSNETLYEQAVSDELTGLGNRRGFNARIEGELRRIHRKGENLALLLIDVDDFKRYNDTFGHPAGDAALTAVGRVIRSSLHRAADNGCRIGGEEFAVLVPETDDAGALAVGERIRRGVERLGIMQGADAHHRILTVSIGIASTSRYPGSDALALSRRADRALYDAKKAGRNTVRFQGASEVRTGERSSA